jgi:hypothetical protein
MNDENINRASGAAIGFIAASVVFAVLVVAVKFLVNVPAIDANSAAARTKALFKIRTNEVASFNDVGWIDQPRGIVRLPIATALQLAEHNWQNPAAARADLIAREEKASAPAPVAPAKPNPFE